MVPASAALQQSAMQAGTCTINWLVDIKKLVAFKKKKKMHQYKGMKDASRFQRN